MFGNQIGGKRQQEQQDDLRGGLVTAPAAEEAHRAAIRPAHHKPGQHAANRHFQKLDGGAADGKDHGAHRHRDGKLERDQAGGVVHQRLTLQNTHDFFGIRPSPTIPESATASVGDSTAASANAGISGMPGTIQ